MSRDTRSTKNNRPPVETSEIFKSHPTYSELKAEGRSLRDKCPREAHAVWQPGPDRHDPIHLLEESSKGRIPELIPIRYGRMIQSPFAFYRGTALNMAADLATTPVSGLRVQACGDCQLLRLAQALADYG